MKKFITILIVLVIVTLLLWLLWGMFQRAQLSEPSTDPATAGVPQAQAQTDSMSLDDVADGIKDSYKQDPDFMQCSQESVQRCLTQAINAKVEETGDLSLCDDFLTEESRTACRVAQSYQLARENADTTYCDALEDPEKNHCLREVAIAKGIAEQTLEYCGVLTDEQENVRCVRSVVERLVRSTGDSAWCENLSEDERSVCVRESERFQVERVRQGS